MRLNQKVSDEQIKAAMAEGLNQAEIARRFGLSKSAVGERVARLRALVRVPSGEVSGSEEQAGDINIMEQLRAINRDALTLLRRAMTQGKTDPVIAAKRMSEIRQQLECQVKIFSTLYDLQEAAEFQRAVLAEIEAASPEVRERIIKRLKEWHARKNRPILPS